MWSQKLANSAYKKASILYKDKVFEHNYPNNDTWQYFDRDGTDMIGENLSKNFSNGTLAFNALMKSRGHYLNIVGTYTDIGIACVNKLCVYHFAHVFDRELFNNK